MSLLSVISSRRLTCSTTDLAAISFRRREAPLQSFLFSLSMVGAESKFREHLTSEAGRRPLCCPGGIPMDRGPMETPCHGLP